MNLAEEGEEKMQRIRKIGISLIKEKYFTQNDLIKRGWNLEEITTLLPKATLFENLTNNKFPPIKCWKKTVVEQVEKKKAENEKKGK